VSTLILAAGLLAASRVLAGQGLWSTNGPTGESVTALAMDPCDSRILYAAGVSAIFKTVNGGETWSPIPGSPGGASFLTTTPTSGCVDPATVYAGHSQRLLRSIDGGAHFSFVLVPGNVLSLAVDPSDSSRLYVGTDVDVLESDDGGVNWASTATCKISPVKFFAIDHDDPSIVFAGGGGPPGFFEDCQHSAVLIAKGAATPFRQLLGYSDQPYFPDEGALEVIGLVSKPGSNGVVYASEYTVYGASVSQFNGSGYLTNTYPVGLRARISSLAVDPLKPGTLYAGTDRGVFVNDEADHDGSPWSPLLQGLTAPTVSSLVIDPSGTHLYAGTTNGVFDIEFSTQGPPRQCLPDTESLCMLGGRFHVEIAAVQTPSGRLSPGFAVNQGDRFGYFSFPEFTGDAEFPEVVVKMVDGRHLPGHSFWFFESSLTSLPYKLTVTDLQTGAVRVYDSEGFCGHLDTAAFADEGDGEVADAAAIDASGLEPHERAELSLLGGGHFRVTLSAVKRNGRTASGVAIQLGDRAGYFSLPDFTGDHDFPEVYVKMVDFSNVDGSFWFFHTGLTSLEYTLTVTDTDTGAVRTYAKASGSTCGGADTGAFRE
jgi:hypothetical protein